jgi:hypothetical protein
MIPTMPGDSGLTQNSPVAAQEHSAVQQKNPQQNGNGTDKTHSGKSPKGHGSKFDHKADPAITALLTCRTIEEAAKTAGIGVQTLLRWMKNRKFKAKLHRAYSRAFDQATGRLVQASSAAVTTLPTLQTSVLTKNDPVALA